MEKIIKCFYELTKRNWGWPYHIILADILTTMILFILLLFNTGMPFLWLIVLAWSVTNLVGYIYEAFQKEKSQAFLEDIVGNNVGIILAGIKAYLIYSPFT